MRPVPFRALIDFKQESVSQKTPYCVAFFRTDDPKEERKQIKHYVDTLSKGDDPLYRAKDLSYQGDDLPYQVIEFEFVLHGPYIVRERRLPLSASVINGVPSPFNYRYYFPRVKTADPASLISENTFSTLADALQYLDVRLQYKDASGKLRRDNKVTLYPTGKSPFGGSFGYFSEAFPTYTVQGIIKSIVADETMLPVCIKRQDSLRLSKDVTDPGAKKFLDFKRTSMLLANVIDTPHTDAADDTRPSVNRLALMAAQDGFCYTLSKDGARVAISQIDINPDANTLASRYVENATNVFEVILPGVAQELRPAQLKYQKLCYDQDGTIYSTNLDLLDNTLQYTDQFLACWKPGRVPYYISDCIVDSSAEHVQPARRKELRLVFSTPPTRVEELLTSPSIPNNRSLTVSDTNSGRFDILTLTDLDLDLLAASDAGIGALISNSSIFSLRLNPSKSMGETAALSRETEKKLRAGMRKLFRKNKRLFDIQIGSSHYKRNTMIKEK